MSGLDFLDTNILVYAYDTTDLRKQKIAQELLRNALEGRSVISAQVLAELATTLLYKIKPTISAPQIDAILASLNPIKIVASDGEMVRRAVQAHSSFGLHFWDGLIVAAAERGRCIRVLSEDLNHGQDYFGVVATNPFL